MKIHSVQNFRFLGFELTHKSKMLPKAIRDSYEFHYGRQTPYNYSFKEKIIIYLKKFLGGIFHNYVVETKNQRTARLWSYDDIEAMTSIRAGELKSLNLTNDEIKSFKKMNDDEIINYIKQQEKTGRFKKNQKVKKI